VAVGVILGIGTLATPAGATDNSFTGTCFETAQTCTGSLDGGTITTHPVTFGTATEQRSVLGSVTVVQGTSTLIIGSASITYSYSETLVSGPLPYTSPYTMIGAAGGMGIGNFPVVSGMVLTDLTG
jgi:hypothetical protein